MNVARKRTRRRYDASRRRAQAEETCRDIVAAAHRRFNERGYVGATMEAIAREAGVAVETIYAAFGTKLALLKRLVGISMWGDDRRMKPEERPGVMAVVQEGNQRRQIEMFAAF